MDITTELRRTNPDYIVYVPKSIDGSTYDTGNEHFLVFDGPDGSLMAVWTQSTCEGNPNQRIVFSNSDDEGESWSTPKLLAGPVPPTSGGLASWGFPMVSRSGRIYVTYSQHVGINDYGTHTTGLMHGIYSDDAGKSWSEAQNISTRRSSLDNPDKTVPANWIVWQKPLRLSEGKYFAGMTRWVSPSVRHEKPGDSWIQDESVVEFIRWENLDENPEPKDLEISNFAFDEKALRVSYPSCPELSVAQEPSIVALPNDWLFTTMRTSTGNPYYSISKDAGRTWSKPDVLRYSDDGEAIYQPLSPCPIYAIGGGRYIFLYHNHDGHFEDFGPFDTGDHRRPIYIALGEFRKSAQQPIWFSQPKFMMDNDGTKIGYKQGRSDLAMYASFTVRSGKAVLWYPERKFFLLGRNITNELLEDLTVTGR